MRAPRYSAFRISTRCRSPTERLPTRASGCTGRPKRCATSSSLARAARAARSGCHSGSVPIITLSSTLRLSASVKCWCTMPMPAASAAFGLPGGSGWPKTSIVARVGDVVAEQDRHQRRLAGAVLAEQRQHLAGVQLERDGVVGHQRAEALGDAAQRGRRTGDADGLRSGRSASDPAAGADSRYFAVDFGWPSSTLTVNLPARMSASPSP